MKKVSVKLIVEGSITHVRIGSQVLLFCDSCAINETTTPKGHTRLVFMNTRFLVFPSPETQHKPGHTHYAMDTITATEFLNKLRNSGKFQFVRQPESMILAFAEYGYLFVDEFETAMGSDIFETK